MHYRLDWEDLRLVMILGRERTLAGAARALNVDHSTMHRRVNQVEKRVGVRLFERLRTGYVPTPAGELAMATALGVDQEISRLETKLAGEDSRPAGSVRITTTDTVLIPLLTPLFAEFRELQPQILLEVGTTSQELSLTRREADIAIRVTQRPPEHLVGRSVGDVITRTYASGEYLARHQRGRRDHWDWIDYDEKLGHLEAAAWIRKHVDPAHIVYRSDTPVGLAEAAKAGIGIALLPHILAGQGTGLRPLSRSPAPVSTRGLWLLTHPDLRNVSRVRAVLDFLGQRLPPLVAGSVRASGRRASKGA